MAMLLKNMKIVEILKPYFKKEESQSTPSDFPT